ncbi:MAG: ABC transporter substrate-binding protein [Trueperaceae bacterium]|nr:ABC transporter substrate-binding protein [Trueperaceae bacterium]
MLKRMLILALGLFSFMAFAQSARQSTLVVGVDLGDLITLDPQVSYEFSGSLITDNLYETLVRFEGNDLSEVQPSLASTWSVETQADGSHKIVFNLRDASFSSGNPVTAADVVYSFDRAIGIAGPSSFLITDVAKMTVGSTVAVDDQTVELNIPADANPNIVLNLLTFNIGGIVDSKVVMEHEVDGDFGSTWLRENSAGSGPYVLERWDAGAQVILTANENASRVGPIKRVILRNMQESSAQQAALESGEIDVAYNFTPEAFNAAKSNPDYTALQTDSFQMTYLGMNSGEGKAFADNRIRQAVRYAVDQDGIINDLLGGLGRKMQTIIPFGLFASDDTLYYERDVEKAKSLLAEAGADGLSVEFLVSTGSCGGGIPCADLGAKIQSDLAEVGINANIRQLPQSELLDIYRAQGAELVVVGWSPDYPDPDGNATPLGDYNAKSLAWRNDWNNPEASELAAAAALEADSAKRGDLYGQLTKLVAEEGPFAILYQPSVPIVTRAYVQDFIRNAQGNVDFDKVSKTE